MKTFRISPTFELAGWLFADLLLALAVLFTASGGFGATAGGAPATPTPTPTPTSTPTPTPTSSPTSVSVVVSPVTEATPVPTAISSPAPTAAPGPAPTAASPTAAPFAVHLQPFCWELNLPELLVRPSEADQESARGKIRAALANLDSQVSLVMTFGGSGDSHEARDLAERVNDILSTDGRFAGLRRPDLMRAYIDLDSSSRGSVWIEAWLDARVRQPSGRSAAACP